MAYIPPSDWELKDFLRDHVDAVYRSCCFLTCGRGDALAMTGDIFRKIVTQGMEFRSGREARAWMLLTAYKMGRKIPKGAQPCEMGLELHKLSRKNRLVALLYYCEGYRKQEIADLLGCPEFWVRWRLARVKRKLDADGEPEEETELLPDEDVPEEPEVQPETQVEEASQLTDEETAIQTAGETEPEEEPAAPETPDMETPAPEQEPDPEEKGGNAPC